MIKTLKRKFIVTAMIAVTVLLVLMLGAVNAVNAWTASQDAARLLDNLVQMEAQGRRGQEGFQPGFPQGEEPPTLPEGEEFEDLDDFDAFAQEDQPFGRGDWGRPGGFMPDDLTENDRLSAVYFAAWVKDGTLTRTDLSRIYNVSQDTAAALVAEVLESGKTQGRVDSYRYSSAANADGAQVYVFLENSSRRNGVLRVAVLSGLAGLGGWLLMLGLVCLLAKRTIAPIAENMARQRQFVTDAGHELKTPLAIIQANTEAMELIAGENKWSRNIKAQTQRLTELTRNLLTLARAEEVPALGSFAPVALSALVEKSLQMFSTSMENRGLRLEKALDPEVTVQGSETQLGTLLSILLDNAVKYASQGSTLSLRLSRGEKACSLRLENRCDRLPDCPPDRLFDRFYRGDSARTQSGGGFGIGLSAAQVIALQHRGRLDAEYPAEDRIAFTVTLPV
ncbi:MAG: HAMP domain-containing histidine kinase [Oscillospiraceae bacterium]|nr:HAMP domain-containing histidine kinase [Oscillospiraceae bacterium]